MSDTSAELLLRPTKKSINQILRDLFVANGWARKGDNKKITQVHVLAIGEVAGTPYGGLFGPAAKAGTLSELKTNLTNRLESLKELASDKQIDAETLEKFFNYEKQYLDTIKTFQAAQDKVVRGSALLAAEYLAVDAQKRKEITEKINALGLKKGALAKAREIVEKKKGARDALFLPVDDDFVKTYPDIKAVNLSK